MSDPINISLTKKVFNATTFGRGLRGYGVEIDISEAGMLQWRQLYTGAPWNDLIAMSSLKGDTGDPGAAAHVHIKWHAEGSETLLDTPDAYIGIYADNEIADSEVFADYNWYLYKGEKGNPAPNTIFQYSVNNIDWTTTATGAQWYRQSGDNGTTWSEAIVISTTAYADAKVAESITEDVTGIAPSQAVVFDALALKAPLASPTFTGDVVVPDQTAGNNSTKAANTKYVDAKVSDAIVNGVTGIAPSQNVVYDELLIKEQIDNLTYAGVDLTTKFATEIAGYADVWAWIKARITAVNYAGLNIGDYIPWTLGAETIWSQIAGIDTHYRTGDTEIGHHIDFVSKDCMATAYQWNTTNINNGDATNPAPWMVSALKASLDGLVASLPAGLQAQIIEKKAFIERRYSSSGALSNSTSFGWYDIGKLWIPTEYEVVGSIVWGTKPYAATQAYMYPIFSCIRGRVKGAGHNKARSPWWLLSVYGGSSTDCGLMTIQGTPTADLASHAYRIPLCFRIG